MNKQIQDCIEVIARNIKSSTDQLSRVMERAPLIPNGLSDSASVYFYETSIEFHTSLREDVEILMTMAPEGKFWQKSVHTDTMKYRCLAVGDNEFDPGALMIVINASDKALPPTCTEVEEPVEEPARPARTYMRKVIKCNLPERKATPSEEAMASEPVDSQPRDPSLGEVILASCDLSRTQKNT